MRFEIYGVRITNAFESPELGGPIHITDVDGRPDDFAGGVFDGVLNVAMMDAIFGQDVPASGIGVEFATHDGVTGVPVEREIPGRDAGEGCGGLTACRCVALKLILQHEQHIVPRSKLCGLLQLLIDGVAVRLYVVDSPEVKAAHLVGLELFGQRDRSFQNVLLLLERGLVGTMEVFLGAVFRSRGFGPVDLIEWAADVGDLQIVFGKDRLRLCDVVVGDGLQILSPDRTELDPVQAELLIDHVARMVEVLGDFIGDDAYFEL